MATFCQPYAAPDLGSNRTHGMGLLGLYNKDTKRGYFIPVTLHKKVVIRFQVYKSVSMDMCTC